MPDQQAHFYVYILFDADAIPRYVGKGKGRRWLQHDKANDPNNELKNDFIRATIARTGCVPKIKIGENLIERDAFNVEAALIKAIGRHPFGPLVNLTDKRNGPSSERIKAWHASRTPEERSASALKARATDLAKNGAEAMSERMRQNNARIPREIKSARMKAARANQTPEERIAIARMAGLASSKAMPLEQKQARVRRMQEVYMASYTPEQRRKNYKKTGAGKATKEQLSAWGQKGATKLNKILTHEQRCAASKKSHQTISARRAATKRQSDAQQCLFENTPLS